MTLFSCQVMNQFGELDYEVYNYMELTTIKAAVTGDYGAALQAFTLNPLVPSGKIAGKILDELLVAHKKHLPPFKEKIAQLEAE